MRALPDFPSLDHLRQQAKDVLPHLRAVREGATLSDAQAHVAHQYGFRTWPAPASVTPWLTCVRTEHLWRSLHAAAADAGKPWADRFGEAIPTLLEANTIVEPAPPSEALVLSGCHYAPGAFCVAGADDLAVMTWEHAGAIPPRWDFGSTLFFWSQGLLGKVHGPAAKALVTGYAAEHPLPEPLDLGIFSAALCASTSWLTSRMRIALAETEPASQEKADRTVSWLLEDPPARAKFEAVPNAL